MPIGNINSSWVLSEHVGTPWFPLPFDGDITKEFPYSALGALVDPSGWVSWRSYHVLGPPCLPWFKILQLAFLKSCGCTQMLGSCR